MVLDKNGIELKVGDWFLMERKSGKKVYGKVTSKTKTKANLNQITLTEPHEYVYAHVLERFQIQHCLNSWPSEYIEKIDITQEEIDQILFFLSLEYGATIRQP